MPDKKRPDKILWLNDARGIYLPRDFASSFDDRSKRVSDVSDEDWAILDAGPDHSEYWDTWCEVEQDARVTDDDGNVFTVYQDGDCWLIPVGMEWSDEQDTFVWPDEKEQDDES